MTQRLKIIIGAAALCGVIAFNAPLYLEVRECRSVAIDYQMLKVQTKALLRGDLHIRAIEGYAEMEAMREKMKNYCKGSNYDYAILGNIDRIGMKAY